MAAVPKKADSGANSGGKKKLFLIIGLVVALVALSVGGTLAAMKFLVPPPTATAAVEPAGPVALAPAIYLQLTPNFTINFNVNGRQRFLQAELTLVYRDKNLEALLKLHMPAIRNNLVMLMSGKQFDELQTPEGKEQLRGEALAAVQAIVAKELAAQTQVPEAQRATGSVEQVLFTTFLMQ